ncbi:MAG: NosD domain-containing protein [Promethearchaeota archaeon]
MSNNITNNHYYGISIDRSINMSLDGNNITSKIACIRLDGAMGVFMEENLLFGSGLQVEGNLSSVSSHNIEITNLAGEKPIYYYINKTSLDFTDFINAGQIILVNCNDSKICNQEMNMSTEGISLLYSNGNLVSRNIITNCVAYGLSLKYSDDNILYFNNVSSNNYGLYLFNSENNTFHANNITNNNGTGMILITSSYNYIDGNDINHNSLDGIHVLGSSQNIIKSNLISFNDRYGVYIQRDVG